MNDRDTLSPNTFAAIYCRISSDKTGAGLGVERQEADCRELATRLGVTVQHVLVDNDISAYSGKPRPSYQRLLELMKEGEIGYVLAWHTDRIHRSMVELEDYVICAEAGDVTTHTVKAGFIDLSTPSGRFNARIIGASARYEVEHMIERQQSAKLQAAKAGKFLGGQRPFGFEAQRTALRDDEAAIIREMAGRIIEGESYRTIAVDLNRRGILTQHGKLWKPINVRNVLIRPVNVGIVHHRGVDYPAESPAILSRDEWDAMNAAMKYSRVRSKHPGRFRKHLLNGLLYCAICDQKLFHKSKQQRDGSYKTTATCGKTDAQTGQQCGCGGVSRMVEPIIDLVTDAVLYRLDSPQLVRQMQKTGNDPLKELMARQRTLQARLNEITDDYYVKHLLSREEFERLKLTTDGELTETEKAINNTAVSTLPGLSLADDIRTAWENGSLEWRRDLLMQVIERIDVHPKPKVKGYVAPIYKSWRFDPDLIEIKWRV